MKKEFKRHIIIPAILVSIISLSACTSQTTSNSTPTTNPTSQPTTQAVLSDETNKVSGQEKVFTIESSNFTFDIKEIKVKKGDKVKIILKNKEGLHDWVVDEFNGKTKQLKAGEEDTIEFTADKVGTFEYYCSVMKHRQMGMVGKLIVEE